MCLGHLCRGDDLLHRRLPPAEADVLPDRRRKEKGLLKDDPDLAAKPFQLDGPHVFPVDGDLARLHVVKSGDQADKRAFPGPVGPRIPTTVPAGTSRLDVAQRRFVGPFVGEGDLVKGDTALDAPDVVRVADASRMPAGSIEDLKDP